MTLLQLTIQACIWIPKGIYVGFKKHLISISNSEDKCLHDHIVSYSSLFLNVWSGAHQGSNWTPIRVCDSESVQNGTIFFYLWDPGLHYKLPSVRLTLRESPIWTRWGSPGAALRTRAHSCISYTVFSSHRLRWLLRTGGDGLLIYRCVDIVRL